MTSKVYSNTYHAVILAAGLSSRMGMHKGLLIFKGMPLIILHIKTIKEAGIEEMSIICNPDNFEAYQQAINNFKMIDDVNLIVNTNYHLGMFSSIKLGLNPNVPNFVLPVDTPPINFKQWIKIQKAFESQKDIQACIPSCQSRGAHPILLSDLACRNIKKLPDDSRLDHYLAQLPTHLKIKIEVDDVLAVGNINTPSDYKEVCKLL